VGRRYAGRCGYPHRVDWFFTALLVITALATTGLAGLGAYRIFARQPWQ
jgi:hypothetical protein